MDETLRAILRPVGQKASPWDEYQRPPHLIRVQGNSKYVPRRGGYRSVSTDAVLQDARTKLPALAPFSDQSLRGAPGTAGPTPRMTLMASRVEQIQDGARPLEGNEQIDHFHRFNKSTNCRLLRQDNTRNDAVQIEYILNKKPKPVQTEAVAFAISAFKRAPTLKALGASRGPSSTASQQSATQPTFSRVGSFTRVGSAGKSFFRRVSSVTQGLRCA